MYSLDDESVCGILSTNMLLKCFNRFPGTGNKWQHLVSREILRFRNRSELWHRDPHFYISTVVLLGFCTRDAFCPDYHHPTHNTQQQTQEGEQEELIIIRDCVQSHSNTQHTRWIHRRYIQDESFCIACLLCHGVPLGQGLVDSCSTKCTFGYSLSPSTVRWLVELLVTTGPPSYFLITCLLALLMTRDALRLVF
jgi:hypothetical protein